MATTDDKLNILISTIDRASGPLRSIQASLVGLAGAYISFRGAQAVFQAAIDVVQAGVAAAAEQEAVNTKLAVSIANMGARSQDTVAGLGAQADALTRLTGISDETVGEVQNLLISLGRLTGQGLERATRATLDFATQTGTDAVTAARQLSGVLSGQVQTLGRVHLAFDETAKGAERFSAVLGAMEGRFSGAAAAAGGTFAGQLRVVAEAQENLLEAIGETIITTPEATEVIKGLADIFGVLEEAVRSVRFREFVSLVAADIAFLAELIGKLGAGLSRLGALAPFEGMREDAKAAAKLYEDLAAVAGETRKRIEELRSAAVVLASLEIIPPAERAEATIAKIQALRAELGLVSTATVELTAKAHELRSLELIPDADKTLDTRARIKALREEVLAVAPAAKAAGAGLAGLDEDAVALKKTLDGLGPAFASLLDVQGVDAAQTVLQALVSDLAKLGDAGPLKLIADLDVAAPDLAKAADAALKQVNADALVKVFADAGDEGSLALLASMTARLPEIAQAAEQALATIRLPELGQFAPVVFPVDVDALLQAESILQGIGSFQQELIAQQGQAVLGAEGFNVALTQAIGSTGSLAAAWREVEAGVIAAAVNAAQTDAIQAQGELLLGADGFRILMLQAAAATDSQAEAWARVAEQIGALDFNEINEDLVRAQGEAIFGAEQFNALLLQAWQTTGDLSQAWGIVAEEVAVATDAAVQHQATLDLIAQIQEALKQGALQFGDFLVDAAFGADVSFRKFFKQLMIDIAKAIVQALILKAITSSTGVGFFGFNKGGQVPDTASLHPTGFAAGGGQILPGAAVGGQIATSSGIRSRDSVPVMLSPGEVVVRNEVVEEIERALRTSANQRQGLQVNNYFQSLVTRDLVEEFTRQQGRLAENLGLEVLATRIV